MQIVRQNKEKKRTVFFDGNHYIKVWADITPRWIGDHVRLLREINPGYVADYGGNWISFNVIPGVPASTFEHTPEFVKRIHEFCLNNIKQTSPYAHGDWSLSNILIDGDDIRMCDWDNVAQYHPEEVLEKLEFDLKNAFGDLYVF